MILLNKKIIENKRYLLILIGIISTLFMLPSVFYFIKYKTILPQLKTYYSFGNIFDRHSTIGLIIFLICFLIYLIIYFKIIKNSDKIFKNNKQIFIFTVFIAIAFTVILPYGDKDIFAYIANGWVNSNYKENPYYTSVAQITGLYQTEDEMLKNVASVWKNEKLTYGPVCITIGSILTALSHGNVAVSIMIFKLFNLLIYFGCIVLIVKIVRKKKLILAAILHPTILLQALSNAHNDLWVMFFILLSIYFTIKRKNIILSIVPISIAVAVKYVAILIIPFLVIYLINEKNIKEKIADIIIAVITFLVTILNFYFPYMQDWEVFKGLLLQQRKI